ncbi:MAG: epoxyqueuosine reductase [Desulfobacteraceae bacterium]|jgi:epoxyqueuosine reductase QueG
MALPANPSEWIEKQIRNLTAKSDKNCLGPDSQEPAFDAPLVGFSNGGDPLFDQFVSHIGDFYLTPLRIFRNAFPESSGVTSDQLTVISWVLPSTAAVRDEQAEQTKRPSRRWAQVRFYGEEFNMLLRKQVVKILTGHGVEAVAPMAAKFWSRSDKGPYAPGSNWSERHAAYASGLGTFGLCDGLITPLGKAMRTGSVVARIGVPPTPRPYTDHHAYCLYYSHGTCGKCIPRCPVKAIDEHGHNKKRCQQYTEIKMPEFLKKTYNIDISACGLCQVEVPCMHRIPNPEEGL